MTEIITTSDLTPTLLTENSLFQHTNKATLVILSKKKDKTQLALLCLLPFLFATSITESNIFSGETILSSPECFISGNASIVCKSDKQCSWTRLFLLLRMGGIQEQSLQRNQEPRYDYSNESCRKSAVF